MRFALLLWYKRCSQLPCPAAAAMSSDHDHTTALAFVYTLNRKHAVTMALQHVYEPALA